MAKSASQVRIEKARLAAACDNLRLGLFPTQAYELATLGSTTVDSWKRLAAKGKQPYVGYVAEIEKAEAQAEQVLLAKIQKAASDGTWTAAAWILERRWTARWRKPEQVEHSGGVNCILEWKDAPNGGTPKNN
jgi:hypothetical protein